MIVRIIFVLLFLSAILEIKKRKEMKELKKREGENHMALFVSQLEAGKWEGVYGYISQTKADRIYQVRERLREIKRRLTDIVNDISAVRLYASPISMEDHKATLRNPHLSRYKQLVAVRTPQLEEGIEKVKPLLIKLLVRLDSVAKKDLIPYPRIRLGKRKPSGFKVETVLEEISSTWTELGCSRIFDLFQKTLPSFSFPRDKERAFEFLEEKGLVIESDIFSYRQVPSCTRWTWVSSLTALETGEFGLVNIKEMAFQLLRDVQVFLDKNQQHAIEMEFEVMALEKEKWQRWIFH